MAFESGVSHADFWSMTIQEIRNAWQGYTDRELNGWRRTRYIAAAFAGKKPTELFKLPGDDETANIEEEIKKLKEMRQWRPGH